MALAMKIEKQSSKFIKPFIPTPQTLHHYKLSLIDEIFYVVNLDVVLFFSGNSDHTEKYVALLEKSIEKILARFYPLAGRYDEGNNVVVCNDHGAMFIKAKVDINLQDILVSHTSVMLLQKFIPSKLGASHQYDDPLLSIQVMTFECGGVALGVTATHKIVDTATLCTFINELAIMNREENDSKFTWSSFNSSSILPGRGLRSISIESMSDDVLRKYTRIKLSFSESSILNLKRKGNSTTHHRSKVQLVAAIIWKAFIYVDRAIHNFPRESILIQAVNIREKMASLIPKNSCGNLWGLCATKSTSLETTEELAELLSVSVKKMITELSKEYHNNEDAQTKVLNSFLHLTNTPESTNAIILTSWCKFPFYEVDFGFGKPIWVAPGSIPLKNVVHIMDDSEGNGVEAYVFLEVKDAPYFEEAFARVNAFSA